MKFNEKIRQLREQKDLTQEQMAEKLGMSKAGYAKIERGETQSNFHKLEQILAIFEMNLVDFVLFGEDRHISIQSENHHSNTHLSVILSDKNTSFELEKLNLIISHQNEIITQLKQENILLKDMIALLKKSD